MSDLSNSIYRYYIDHFEELSLDKQFHFTSRLYVWSKDAWSRTQLDKLRQQLLPTNDPTETLGEIGSGRLLPLRYGSENLRKLRAPYFARYPKLRQYAAILYWGLLLEHLYGIDGRQAIAGNIPDEELEHLYTALLADPQAVAVLSTYAVNFLYIYQRFVRSDDSRFSPTLLESITSVEPDISSLTREALQIKLYLLTHCLVAESLFYTRKLPEAYREDYAHVLHDLELMIRSRFADVGLDNKLEFLVCCRLADHTAALETQILAEASRSTSPSGTYLVDTENANRVSPYTDLDKSEHRNVLYILSQRPLRR